ncbi:unnamed protein product [Calypogeia fissa]
MFAGVNKNGLQFVVERQLRPSKGGNMSAILRKLGQRKHPHIVKVLGYCLDDTDNSVVAVIHERKVGGNLSDALQNGRLSRHPHNWGCRFDISLGVVRAVHYLHENQPANANPLHYKITSSEVVLDLAMKAYLLARVLLSELDLSRPESSFTSSSSAPEKPLSSSCTDGTDIYDLGVLLLEILSGRPPTAPDGMTIVEWFERCLEMESGVEDMLDPTLGNNISTEAVHQIESLFSVARRCLAKRPEERPSLDEMLMYLLRISKPMGTGDQRGMVWLKQPSRLSLST